MSKEYYNLVELITITDLKYRNLLYRMKKVKNKYKKNKNLIMKEKNIWKIHKSLIKEFQRKRKKIEYKQFATINFKYKYDNDYLNELVNLLYKDLKKVEKDTRIKYVIEKTKNGINHIHFITNFSHFKQLKSIINNSQYIDKENTNTLTKGIFDINKLLVYLNKENKIILLNY